MKDFPKGLRLPFWAFRGFTGSFREGAGYPLRWVWYPRHFSLHPEPGRTLNSLSKTSTQVPGILSDGTLFFFFFQSVQGKPPCSFSHPKKSPQPSSDSKCVSFFFFFFLIFVASPFRTRHAPRQRERLPVFGRGPDTCESATHDGGMHLPIRGASADLEGSRSLAPLPRFFFFSLVPVDQNELPYYFFVARAS